MCFGSEGLAVFLDVDRGIVVFVEGALVVEVVPLTANIEDCLLYTSPSPRDLSTSRMPSSA